MFWQRKVTIDHFVEHCNNKLACLLRSGVLRTGAVEPVDFDKFYEFSASKEILKISQSLANVVNL